MYTIEALLESVMKSIILAPLFTLTQTERVYILGYLKDSNAAAHSVDTGIS